jgi:hypothetical protein
MATKQELMTPVKTPTIEGGKSFNEAMGIQAPYLEKQSQLQSGISAAEGDILRGQQTQKEVQAVGEEKAQKGYATAEKGAMQQYQQKLEAEPLPAFIPTKDTAQDIAGLFSLIGVIGMIAGKGDAQKAMGAMNGMLEGHRKGRADLYKQQASEFDKNFKAMMQKHAEFRKEMEDAVKLAATDKEAGIAAAKLAAVRSGSSIINAQIDKGDLMGAYKNVDESKKATENAYKVYTAEKRHAEDMAARERMRLATLQAAQGRRDQKSLEAIGPALRNIAEQYPEGSADKLVGASPEDKKRIQGSYRAVEESEQVADFVAKNKGAVGALAAVKNFLKIDAINSIKNEDEAAAAAQKAQLVDSAIDQAAAQGKISTQDAQNAKVLQKKLFGLALADVQSSGQRGSVYLDRQFQNLYDQASRQDTLLKIIKERAEENNRNLRVYRLNVERHNNPEQFPLLESKDVGGYIKERVPAETSGQDYSAEAMRRFKAYEPNKYNYGYEDGKFYREEKK